MRQVFGTRVLGTMGITALVAVWMSGIVLAADKPPESYQAAMKTLAAFMQGIDKAVAAEDYPAVEKLAMSARDAFEVTEKYWRGRKDDTTADLALGGYKSAADLQVVAGIKDKEGAAFSAGEVKAACGTCHMGHREAQPDGTFLIK